MKWAVLKIQVLLFLLSVSIVSLAQQFPFSGSLIIVGGGEITDEMYSLFAEKIGGKDKSIIYIPTATNDEAWIKEGKHLEKFTSRGFTNLQTVHTRNKSEAMESKFSNLIKDAKGVFLGGGDQENLSKIYGGTTTMKALNELLQRGGVIMGTSAGATIMGSLMIGGDHRKTPHLSKDFSEGFSFLKQTAIDQHVLVRNRQFDLVPVLERDPNILGIALDEATAGVVAGDSIRVIGKSYMLIFNQNDWEKQRKTWGRVYQPFKMYAPGAVYKLNTK
jgi:cyanophycinase